ncbi:MAG: PLP-dependent transferase, partial [Verrucomicrobia bacterium]|nr:PLP-dependent transferase [Verrucomicrobiota bacterium]
MWRSQDLGWPIPDSPHAVSVALPLWQQEIGYEEKDPAVLEKLQCGYPRFLLHPEVDRLNAMAEKRLAGTGEACVVFPSLPAAERCVVYVRERFGVEARAEALGWEQLTAVILPSKGKEAALKFWRYGGEIVSSRMAMAALAAAPGENCIGAELANNGVIAKNKLRRRLAELSGQAEQNVFLFSCGMAAIFAVQRVASGRSSNSKSAQFEFPYVDALKVQEEFGPGVHEYLGGNEDPVKQLEKRLQEEQLSAVYTEVPSNPLLRTADLPAVGELTRQHGVPLVIDDTVGTVVNVDAFRFADVVTTSLTKYFSGIGDVMGGVVIVNQHSPFAEWLCEGLQQESGDDLWAEDAIVLEQNSRDFVERVNQINQTTEHVVDFLSDHAKVEQVWYPRERCRQEFDTVRREKGGFGGLLSLLLKDAATAAPKFYDALQVSKGPSLGANYTLACPYTLLAHYDELDWAEAQGVKRDLIRISVGLESTEDLIGRLKVAFESI